MKLGFLQKMSECADNSVLTRLMPYPVICASYNNEFYIVDGIKRFSNNSSEKPLLFQKNMEKPEDQILFWLRINLSYRQINEMEKAILIFALFDEIGKDYSQIIDLLSPFFDLSKQLIEQYISYTKLSINMQKYISKNSPAKNIMKYILAVKKEILNSIDKYLPHIEPNPATLKTILMQANDIFLKTGQNILESEELVARLQNTGLKGFLDFLNEKRFPNLTTVRNNMSGIINNLELKKLRINYDHALEIDGVSISADIKDKKDLKKIMEELEALQKNDFLELLKNAKNI